MKKQIWTTALALLAACAFAAVKLDTVFSSNMVLQQERPITFFGTADPGAEVKVEFDGKTVSAKAGENGKWKAEFPAMKAGSTPYTVTVTDGKEKIELKDVLIGEVWFCSGQSNMQLPVGKKFQRGKTASNCEKEVAAANYPEIRYAYQFRIPSHNAPLPAKYALASGWVKCSPETAHYFSAVSYFFGRKLYQDLKVPIGLINASWGGTKIEPWISQEGYKAFGPASDLKLVEQFKIDAAAKKAYEEKEAKRFADGMKAWHPLFEAAGADARAKAQAWSNADFDDSAWKTATETAPAGYTVRWFRLKFTLPKNLRGKDVTFKLGKVAEKADLWLNGKRIAGWNADDPDPAKTVKITLKADQLDQTAANVLAVRGEYFHGAACRGQLRNLLRVGASLSAGSARLPLAKGWKMNDEFACRPAQTGKKAAPMYIRVPYASHLFQSNLYNGMVAAWTRLPVRGVIWYQGCSNNGRIHYYPLHKTLIADWRARWNNPEMPFLIVQLAAFEPGRAKTWQTADPNQPSGYPLTRDIQQRMMIELPNVGLACAIDIGEPANIHPANKQDVGKRLALEAERIAYGKKIVSRGPLFESAKPEGSAIRVTFKYADSGLKTSDGKAPGAFAVAGADGKFVWAEAKIDGKTVLVSSPKVKEPKFVRYAYAGYRGDCNLQNAEGLPAYPFRSDAVDYSKVE